MTPPATMRALRKVAPGPGLELVEAPVPTPGAGQILVEVAAASICGTDLHIYQWNTWAEKRLRPPVIPGHEVAGRVVATGPEVHHIKEGAFVSAESHVFCGFCPQCRRGRMHTCERLRILGVDFDGGFAEYVAFPERNAWEVDHRIPPDIASIHDPFGNAVHTAFISGGAGDIVGSSVAVLGCGPIGLFAVAVVRAAGARQVVAVEPNEFRQGLAKQMGADVVVNPSLEDPVQAVLGATDGHGAEVVLEMSGIPSVIRQATEMVCGGGRIVLLGLPTEPVALELTDHVIFKEARIYGVTGRELFQTWETMSALLASGTVDVTPVITHRFALEDFERAFEAMDSGRSGKILLLPNGDPSAPATDATDDGGT